MINTYLLAEVFQHSVQLNHEVACYAAGVLSGGRLAYAVTPHPEDPQQRIVWLSDLARNALVDAGLNADCPPGHHHASSRPATPN